ncbi:hypothetical protein AAG565_03080 [Fontimonas sp. SYSU GA230001]|uniref:hypothetical protein n=1 Tax=Fontimonas sp. SYSU GA230001 TaxID=3142450 RepID=UPI0032B45C10
MAGRTTTSQQFRIGDIPDAAAARAQQYAIRENYTRLIARFSPAAERDSEEARFAHRRYAKIMVMDSGHHLRAALSLLHAGQPLTAAEVAAIVVGAERGQVDPAEVRTLLAHPERLPAPDTATEIRAYLLESGNRDLAG